MVNLAFIGDLFAMGTSSTYSEYKVSRAKIFFGVFLTIVAIVLILGFISKKSSPKAVEPPMPSNHTIKRSN